MAINDPLEEHKPNTVEHTNFIVCSVNNETISGIEGYTEHRTHYLEVKV